MAIRAGRWYAAALVFPLGGIVAMLVALGWGTSSAHPFVIFCVRYWWLLLGTGVGMLLVAWGLILIIASFLRARARIKARAR